MVPFLPFLTLPPAARALSQSEYVQRKKGLPLTHSVRSTDTFTHGGAQLPVTAATQIQTSPSGGRSSPCSVRTEARSARAAQTFDCLRHSSAPLGVSRHRLATTVPSRTVVKMTIALKLDQVTVLKLRFPLMFNEHKQTLRSRTLVNQNLQRPARLSVKHKCPTVL